MDGYRALNAILKTIWKIFDDNIEGHEAFSNDWFDEHDSIWKKHQAYNTLLLQSRVSKTLNINITIAMFAHRWITQIMPKIIFDSNIENVCSDELLEELRDFEVQLRFGIQELRQRAEDGLHDIDLRSLNDKVNQIWEYFKQRIVIPRDDINIEYGPCDIQANDWQQVQMYNAFMMNRQLSRATAINPAVASLTGEWLDSVLPQLLFSMDNASRVSLLDIFHAKLPRSVRPALRPLPPRLQNDFSEVIDRLCKLCDQINPT